MQRRRKTLSVILLFAILALMLTGCAGDANGASATGGNSIKELSHSNLDLKSLIRGGGIWTTILTIAISYAFLATLYHLLIDDESVWKWLGIMVAVGLWASVGSALMTSIEDSWPAGLN